MGRVTDFTCAEEKAFDYAEAFSDLGYSPSIISNGISVFIYCSPKLPESIELGLMLPSHPPHRTEV